MSTERDRLSDEMDRLSELQARQDAALGEAWPDNPSPAYRRAREAAHRETQAPSGGAT